MGTEIELWPQIAGEVPPWELPSGSIPFDRKSWVTDERTGSLVRFDVTDIARAWEAGSTENLGFVLRIANVEDLAEQAPAGQQAVNLMSPKQLTLIYHIQPVRPPKVDEVPREELPTGKTPKNEDQGGRD